MLDYFLTFKLHEIDKIEDYILYLLLKLNSVEITNYIKVKMSWITIVYILKWNQSEVENTLKVKSTLASEQPSL